jgi:beta-N-acetylglucosaminidase
MTFVKRVVAHIPLNTINAQGSGYAAAKSRFDEILTTKLGVAPPSMISSQPITSTGIVNNNLAAISEDVRNSSGDSLDNINRSLEGSAMSGLGAAFKAAENSYGVNAYFLTALAAHESDFGSSAIARDKNNLFGFMAYDHNPYESAKSYSSVEESIFDVAQYLSEQYLSEGGKHYNGVSIEGIGTRYATDPLWADKIKNHLKQLLP